jgi:hypothetical protein
VRARLADRIAFWLIAGPLGHLVAGVMDWLELLGRHLWAATRARLRRARP